MRNPDLLSILKETWLHTKAGLQPILGASLLVFAITMGVLTLGLSLLGIELPMDLADEEAVANLMNETLPLQMLMLTLWAPFGAGLAYLGWRRATGQDASVMQVFNTWAMAVPLVLIALVTEVLTSLGTYMMVLPGLYLMAVLSQANLYYLFHRGSPLRAMLNSAKVVHRNLLLVFPFYVVMAVLMVASFMTMGVALVVTVPYYFYGKGVLFRELFPELTPATEEPAHAGESTPVSKPDSFEA
ncbi:hypothetical protein [Ferrimonas gelatinilytica]|uniref:Uncharacterized protein n=1 Tax=Ferrimonas gelatinilytica TaxID=1255257 RepID=A0ABP9RWS3_9GAMM